MKQPLRSKEFDDVYFSDHDGLAETQHVFIEGNGLPGAFQALGQGRDHFTVGETGFGTGLNFLAVWKLFDETAAPGTFLDFVSIEKFPLSPTEIRAALLPWAEELGPYMDKFLAQYPLRAAGFHRIVFDRRVALTLVFDDVNEGLPQVNACVDAWFLDGFTPAKNPEMWSETVFREMARLSASGASFATFTAAGDVKRGLREAGFNVQKRPGFGRKRDMLAGRFTGTGTSLPAGTRPKKIAVVGGGLAGTACAWVLKQYGFTPALYGWQPSQDVSPEKAPDVFPSLYNPRFTGQRDAESGFFVSGFAQVVRAMKGFEDVGHYPCGGLHLLHPEVKQKRLPRTAQNWLWHPDHMRLLTAAEASDVSGIPLGEGALYLPDAGSVDMRKLCAAYAEGIEKDMSGPVEDPGHMDADAVILACGEAVRGFDVLEWLPVHTVRGQGTSVRQTEISKNLKTNICYGGHICAPVEGVHVVGATFQKWLHDPQIREEDHRYNLERLEGAVPSLPANRWTVLGGRAGFRCSAADRFPVVGPVPGQKHVYVLTALGSHGIIGSLAAAHLLADQLRGGPVSLPSHTVYALSAQRFLDRCAKKSRKSR